MHLAQAYTMVKAVASPDDSEGLTKERAILLLWYLRNAMGIDDLEAYEFICDSDDDQGADGLFLEPERDGDSRSILHIFQSKYPEAPKNVGVKELRNFIGAVAPFETPDGLRAMAAATETSSELLRLIKRFELESLLTEGRLQIRLTFVTAGALTQAARRLEEAQNHQRGYTFIRCVDVLDLAPLIQAFTAPGTVAGLVTVECTRSDRFVSLIDGGRVVIVPSVQAKSYNGQASMIGAYSI